MTNQGPELAPNQHTLDRLPDPAVDYIMAGTAEMGHVARIIEELCPPTLPAAHTLRLNVSMVRGPGTA